MTVGGIELSTDMVAQLQAKAGGDAVSVTIGDIATARVGRSFRRVYLEFNTIGNLETQERQVACFANASAHLEPGGHFVIEVGVPDIRRLVPGHDAVVFAQAPATWGSIATTTSSPSRRSPTTSWPTAPGHVRSGHRSGTCGRRSST